jgi:G:T-mismatch repair DNA endonuclease (very short patch repair protein)
LLNCCKTCGVIIYNKNGYCISHRDCSKENNSFFGKKQLPEKMKAAGQKIKKKWKEDENYRDRIVKFRQLLEQRLVCSKRMIRTWKEGKLHSNLNHLNESKAEKQFFSDLKNIYVSKIEKKHIKSEDGHWIIPDVILVDINHIIEFYGDFWHANPKIYKPEDIIHHKIKAKEIWERDKERIERLEKLGYFVHTVWQSEYKNDKAGFLEWFENYFCREGCIF